MNNVLTTSKRLAKELMRLEDDFITVMIENKEYIIDEIRHVPEYNDTPSSHLSLICHFGGEGNIKV